VTFSFKATFSARSTKKILSWLENGECFWTFGWLDKHLFLIFPTDPAIQISATLIGGIAGNFHFLELFFSFHVYLGFLVAGVWYMKVLGTTSLDPEEAF
jgi:hypothetical protein